MVIVATTTGANVTAGRLATVDERQMTAPGAVGKSARMRLLLVEDEPATAQMLAKGLREQAYAVDVARNCQTARAFAADHDYDMIVLDLGLPDGDGLTLCRHLRADGSVASIIVVTARDAVDARIAGLDSGADDYLLKPFDFGELLARLRALARPPQGERWERGGLLLDGRAQRAFFRGLEVPLTTREYALLEFFCRHAGMLMTRGAIAERVWESAYDPTSNVIDVYIRRLRTKLGACGCPEVIRTRRGSGYVLEPDLLEGA